MLGNVGPIPTGRWVAIRVEVRPAKVTVTVDGASPGSVDFAHAWTPNKVTARFGTSEANSPTTGWLVHWNDLVIREL